MKRAISEIVGRARSAAAGQTTVEVYRALRPLRCAACDRLIDEGELFTRRNTSAHGLRILPRCRECAPFALLPAAAASTGHPMLDSILSTAAPVAPVSKGRPSPEDDEKKQSLNKAMMERLGPALKRSRGRDRT
jgi:hypothetical protein